MKKINLKLIIESIFPIIQANALRQDKYIELILDEVPDIYFNENELRQLILNLVRNGLEAMDYKGLKLTIRIFKENNGVILTVQDEGKGIPPEILDKIGNPFFSTKDSGTGLGLASCYGIAHRHGAKIDFDTSSEGTTFYVRFKVN